MAKDILFYVWLSTACQLDSNTPFNVVINFDDLEDFYNLSAEEMCKLEYVERSDIKRLKTITLDDAVKILNKCEKEAISIVTIRDADYPKQLLEIPGIPIILYYMGNIGYLGDQLIIGIVGTRDSNNYTEDVTFNIARNLANRGAVIVSGGALGIDEYAHKGAVSVKGRTVIVAGCGLDVNYPKENAGLRKEVLENNGAIISEVPPGTAPLPQIFPKRNRIIAGLSFGICVTHMPMKSGASITAQLAVEFGKELFCLPPWDVRNGDCMGVMKYIRDGAKVIADAEDIYMECHNNFTVYNANNMFKEYTLNRPKSTFELCMEGANANKKKKIAKAEANKKKKNSKVEPKIIKEQLNKEQLNKVQLNKVQNKEIEYDLENLKLKWKDYYDSLDENETKIFDSLLIEPQLLDEIILKSNVQITKALSILTDFELNGLVATYSGRRYSFLIDD